MPVTKIDDHTIGTQKVVPAVTTEVTYSYSFLKQQLVSIQAQKDRDNALRDVELAEVQALIAEADKLGVVENVIKPTIQGDN